MLRKMVRRDRSWRKNWLEAGRAEGSRERPVRPGTSGMPPREEAEFQRLAAKARPGRLTVFAGCVLAVSPLWLVACGGADQSSSHVADGSSASSHSDAGPQPSSQSDGGQSDAFADAAVTSACMLPSAPRDICSVLPTGKVSPCNQDGGQPSQTGYLEIDSPDTSPIFVCATSWSSDPVDRICLRPTRDVPIASSGLLRRDRRGDGRADGSRAIDRFARRSPYTSHIKPQEMEQPGGGTMRQDPFAVVVTDSNSGAAAILAMSTWLSWAGDGKPHAAPDGTGAYYFAAGFPMNYVVLETSGGFPLIVIGPEVSLTADGKSPSAIPRLACAQRVAVPLSP